MGSNSLLLKVKVGLVTSVLLIFWGLLALYRALLGVLLPLFVGGVREMVEVRNTYFTISPNPSILITSVLEGGVSLEEVRERFQALQETGDGGRRYWKLKYYFKHLLGFSWWVEESRFSLDNHVMEIRVEKGGKVNLGGYVDAPGKVLNQVPASMLQSIETQLMATVFPEGRSPWAFYLLRNYIPSTGDKKGEGMDVVFLKCHHGLGDGYSVIKMLVLDICGESAATLLTPTFPPTSPILLWGIELYAMITAPFVFISSSLAFDPTAALQWVTPPFPASSGPPHLVQSRSIELDAIKKLRKRYGVDYASVLMDGISVTVRAYLKETGQLLEGSLGLPGISPFPFPGHPNHLTNHWSHMDILLPVGEREGVKRAKMIQEKVTGFKGSPIPAFTSLKIHEFLGLLPPSWLSWMTSMAVFPVTVTDFPGPTAPPRLLGKKVVDVHFMLGQIPGGEEFMFCSTSFCGKWKLNLSVDRKYVQTPEEAQRIVDRVVDYFESGGQD